MTEPLNEFGFTYTQISGKAQQPLRPQLMGPCRPQGKGLFRTAGDDRIHDVGESSNPDRP